MDSPILHGLNDAQRQAVAAGGGPHLVLAGPGSGKTRVLTHRVAYLIREMDVHPYRIMAVTFTNKAAREMRLRVEALLGGEISGLTLGTFHATCARILRIEHESTPYTQDYAIFDTRDQLDVIKQASADLNVDPKQYRPRGLLSAISRGKNELLGPAAFMEHAQTYYDEVAGRVYERYQELLRTSNGLDFDDLLMQTVILFREHPAVAEKYQNRLWHVLVDEFQDTNFAQYALIRLLSAPQDNLFVVGDPDQSIYAFRGADYRNVLRFEQDYPDARKILLEQNYRSTQNVLDAAMAVIDRNPYRTPKRLYTERGGGEPLTLFEAFDEDEEAHHVVGIIATLNDSAEFNPSECAVMYRTNAQSRVLENALRRAGMPYRLVRATRFYDRREIKDLIAYLRVIHNPNDTFCLRRAINTPPRGIGNKTQEALEDWAAEQGITMGVALLSLRAGAEGPFSPRARRSLQAFAELLADWRALVDRDGPTLDILDAVLSDVGFEGYLRDGTTEGDERWENVQELRNDAFEHAALADYLTHVSLVSDVDGRDDDEEGPSLMTLHSAKGLEFPVVFIVGLEDGNLPHSRSIDAELDGDPDAIAEERRLLYVGLTRAEDRLYLSYASQRARYGDFDPQVPSRFLYDLPPDLVIGAPLPASARRAYDAFREMTAWAVQTPTPEPSAVPPPRFQAGQRVSHPVFGEGIVIASKRYGDGEEVEVLFPGIGNKRIDGAFLVPLAG